MAHCLFCQQSLPHGKRLSYVVQEDEPGDELHELFNLTKALFDALYCVGQSNPDKTGLNNTPTLDRLAKLGRELIDETERRVGLYGAVTKEKQ